MFDEELYNRHVEALVADGVDRGLAEQVATLEQEPGGDVKGLTEADFEPTPAFSDSERFERKVAELVARGHSEREARQIAAYAIDGSDAEVLKEPEHDAQPE